ncbi:MAG: glycine cleavage system protein H [Calditrichia bacterium]|nr:glycine cleavage system protein H [Calditrichia bacterium]
MEGFQYEDIFATKGVEYLLILAFLVLLVLYFRLLNKQGKGVKQAKPIKNNGIPLIDFFTVTAGFYYHQAHSWLKVENEKTVWVGIDDFANKLLGKIDEIELPKLGSKLIQGEIGWKIKIEGKAVDFISPVNGTIDEVNEVVINSPEKINSDNFSTKWLIKVNVDKLESSVNNLLSGNMAAAWLNESVKQLQKEIPGELWDNFSDEKIAGKGFARLIDENKWESTARKFLSPSSA